MISRRVFCAGLIVGLVFFSGITGVTTAQQRSSRGSSNQLAQQSNEDAAAVMFRSGRDSITDQDWAKAQEKFSQFVSAYPNDKNIDAALYWMAYAMNKQSKIDQCRKTLAQLFEKYPTSAWKEDARLLLAQTLGTTPTPYVLETVPGVAVAAARPIEGTIAYAPGVPVAVTPAY